MRTPLLAAALLLLVAGCAVTREPESKPELPLPDSLPAVASSSVDLPDPWWTLFADPTLDALIREALANNADAAIAAARVAEARAIARIARDNGIELMWGCMDESVIGIAAALHAAYACAATRTLDLDGSFDLARDPARGGFDVVDGRLETRGEAGLGVELSP